MACPYIYALEFDKLSRMVERQVNLGEKVPKFYIVTVSNLEQACNDALTSAKEKDNKKKMSTVNAKALNTTKQKIRKAIKEYDKEVKLFREVSTHAMS